MQSERTGAGFGRGKVILLGEHAVVYGHPALAVGIDRGVTARAATAERDRLALSPWDRIVHPEEAGGEPLAAAYAAVLALYPNRPALDVEVEISLPAGAGLGCSAALGVAIIAAVDDLLRVDRPPERRGELALVWERFFHGNPSGIDNMMAACGGLGIFTKGEPLERVLVRTALDLVIAHSGETSSTKEMVDAVARQYDKDRERIEKTFEAIESLVRNARLACVEGDLVALGQLLDLNHFLLSSLMLCTTKLDHLCQEARRAGAFGAKLTGAGGGGCMVALVPNTDTAQTVVEALRPLSTEVFMTRVEP